MVLRCMTAGLFVLLAFLASGCSDDKSPAEVPVPQTSAAPAVVPEQYPSVEAMAEAMNDFPPENGAFKVLKRDPLHIQLVIGKEVKPESDQAAAGEMFRAFLWGVYRTFLHTSAEQVTVTVVSPIAVEGKKSMTETVTREHALVAAQNLLSVSGLEDLITARQTWSDAMKRCRYDDAGAPGLRACALAVAGKI